MHVQQRVSGDGGGMHERRRQVCIVQRRVLPERSLLCGKCDKVMQVQQRVSCDRISMPEQRRICMCILRCWIQFIQSYRKYHCVQTASKYVHLHQRVSGDGIGMHEQRRQVRVV